MTVEKQILDLLLAMVEHGASDLYITLGSPPMLRVKERLIPARPEVVTDTNVDQILSALLTVRQRHEFNGAMELNTSLDLGEKGRFRINVLRQKQHPALVIRRIVTKIPSFEELGLPPIYGDLVSAKRGLVLVVGMIGSGKSTSLASMIDYRNRSEEGHIVTIEDPIEYYHTHQKGIVSQREVGVDTHSYATALKNALRQRPDVILIGEIRDREVMDQAMMSAETGHLCLATIHANNAYQAIERVVNLFPDEMAKQVRVNLSVNLNAILSQRLIPTQSGGIAPVLEIMINQGLIRELILKGDVRKIKDVMEENAVSGMRTFDQSLIELCRAGEISSEAAISYSDRPSDMKVRLNNSTAKAEEAEEGSALLDKIDTSFLKLRD